MKIVVNRCYGGFSISKKCAEFVAKKGHAQAKAELDEWCKNKKWLDYKKTSGEWPSDCPEDRHLELNFLEYGIEPKFYGYGYVEGFDHGYNRTDETLVLAVETLGNEASGEFSNLKVVEIPDEIKWEISDHDGIETVEEVHRSW